MLAIQRYFNHIDDLRRVSGMRNESVIREAFKDLLKDYARQKDLVFVPEYAFTTIDRKHRRVDGAILHSLRLPLGYWEAKDEADDLDVEIEKKFRAGYPKDNIIFEDSISAVLYQNGEEHSRCEIDNQLALSELLDTFFKFERPEIAKFRSAVGVFKTDLPDVLKTLRKIIDEAAQSNSRFSAALSSFLVHAQKTINPLVGEADIREMLIQHILTEEIFSHVFGDSDFHRENNIAESLYQLESTFFTGAVKRDTLKTLEPYYSAVRSTAARIETHSEKQAFLKVIYEEFYRIYNKKAADRLGVVYTPNEIVKFMVEGADWLCQRSFKKNLIDEGVEILDPATGTGTFICEMIDHFRGQKKKLIHKYKNELYANEVAILPYYVANLNIEATYAETVGGYTEFPNLCFVDTIDNVAALKSLKGEHFGDLLGALSEENAERIKRQNERTISVIIGNPPYNANQKSENDNNKNRTYLAIDKRIRASYVSRSTARKTKAYDMYTRFFRWATDRMSDEGIIAFVTNRNFIDTRTMDGFRRVMAEEFSEAWIVDLGGDVRANPRLSGKKNNVFGIQTGVAISFFVRRKDNTQPFRIFYTERPEMESAESKLTYLANSALSMLEMEEIVPNEAARWSVGSATDFADLIPLFSKETKAAKSHAGESSVFKTFVNGIKTNRDEWVYDTSKDNLKRKVALLEKEINKQVSDREYFSGSPIMKLSRDLKTRVARLKEHTSISEEIVKVSWRPFIDRYYIPNRILGDIHTNWHDRVYGVGLTRRVPSIAVVVGGRLPFQVLAADRPINYSLFSLDPVNCLPKYQGESGGEKIHNVTDWALSNFCAHYKQRVINLGREITKDAIFDYVYAVLHDPVYRDIYQDSLMREFPRIPLYEDFWRWAAWGSKLLKLHVDVDHVEPYGLERFEKASQKGAIEGLAPRSILRRDKKNGSIVIDSVTELRNVPDLAWEYRLGNRPVLEWVLDQQRERRPRDPVIRKNYWSYKLADHKEEVIDLIQKVTRISVDTLGILKEMREIER